jgi:hypothetical protein
LEPVRGVAGLETHGVRGRNPWHPVLKDAVDGKGSAAIGTPSSIYLWKAVDIYIAKILFDSYDPCWIFLKVRRLLQGDLV